MCSFVPPSSISGIQENYWEWFYVVASRMDLQINWNEVAVNKIGCCGCLMFFTLFSIVYLHRHNKIYNNVHQKLAITCSMLNIIPPIINIKHSLCFTKFVSLPNWQVTNNRPDNVVLKKRIFAQISQEHLSEIQKVSILKTA